MKTFKHKVIKQFVDPWHYNIFFAYFAWVFGGLFGAHHFYLKRDRHAFVCCSTVGGCFGIGLLYDFFHIPSYVRVGNELKFTKEKSFHFTDPESQPKLNVTRIFCQFLFGAYLGTIFLAIFPVKFMNEHNMMISLLHAVAVAIGVYTVANIGKVRCSLMTCICGSFITLPFAFVTPAQDFGVIVFYTSLISSFLAFYMGWRYAKPSDMNSLNMLLRFLFVYGSSILVYLLLFNTLYWNTRVISGGVKIPLRDYLENNISWQDLRNSIRKLLMTLQNSGWVDFFLHAIEMMSAETFDTDALKVLQLSTNFTETEITAQYRKLAKVWHPDKFVRSSAWDQKWAEKQFILVRQAYEQLMSYYKRNPSKKFNEGL